MTLSPVLPAQLLSESEPEHILRFHGACLWGLNLVLVTELMQVRPARTASSAALHAWVCSGAR